MKNELFYGALLLNFAANAQQPSSPTGYPQSSMNSQNIAKFAWVRGGNFDNGPAGFNNIFGTFFNSDIFVYTDSKKLLTFTRGNFLTSQGSNGQSANYGNGIRIFDPTSGNGSHLDMFTSNSSGGDESHIVFGEMGQLSAQSERFEMLGNYKGLYFNATSQNGVYKFARLGQVTATVGTNNFWRIGQQTDILTGNVVNANRRLEVCDNTWQFRLSYNYDTYTDFFTTSAGHFLITPVNGRVGINLLNTPSATLDVNGDARIRNVPTGTGAAIFIGTPNGSNSDLSVKRLDFTGNPNQVLLGNGTWGLPLPTNAITSAANGTWINANNQIEWGTQALNHDTQVPLDAYKILFNTGVNSNNTVTIGGNSYNPSARLSISNDNLATGIFVRSNAYNGVNIPTRTGVKSYASNANQLYGIYSYALMGQRVHGLYALAQSGSNYTAGVRALASSGITTSLNYGGDFGATGITYFENVGVRAEADGCVKQNIGGMFRSGAGGAMSIGVYGEANVPDTYIGQAYAGYFAGAVLTSGGSLWGASDETFKDSIQALVNTDSVLMQIETVSFNYKQTGNAQQLNLPKGVRYGVLAQQVEQVIPSVVREVTHPAMYDTLGVETSAPFTYKVVDMSQLVPLMLTDLQKKTIIIEVMNERLDSLEETVETLTSRLDLLENCLSSLIPGLCTEQSALPINGANGVNNAQSIGLSDRSAVVLDQNVPNPFAESTVIRYYLPEYVAKAQLHFYDAAGKLVNSMDVNGRGEGQVSVFAQDLSSGTYTYALVADGQITDTKRMIKE
jgi:hypothetical protein